MKRINFKNLSNEEILTRDELKRIVGGNGSDNNNCEEIVRQCNTDFRSCTQDLYYNEEEGADNEPYWAAMMECNRIYLSCVGDCTIA